MISNNSGPYCHCPICKDKIPAAHHDNGPVFPPGGGVRFYGVHIKPERYEIGPGCYVTSTSPNGGHYGEP